MPLSRTLMLALAIVSAASAETFQVYWDYIPKAHLDVKVGDTVVFIWLSQYRVVYIHPTLHCTYPGAIAVHYPATQEGSIPYTFTSEAVGQAMFFSSAIRIH